MAIPGSRPNNRLVLIIGIVCALIAFGGVLYLLKNSGSGPTTPGLVFKTDLTAGSLLTADSVMKADLPAAVAPRDTIADPSLVVGKQLVGNVTANTPVVPALLVPVGGSSSAGSAGGRLDITAGYVAVSIPSAVSFSQPPATNPYMLTGGTGDLLSTDFYIQPEDHIDILIAIPAASGPEIRYAFQDVRILKVGTSGSAATAAPGSYVVELPRAQAEILTNLVTVTCNPGDTAPGCKSPVAVKYALRPRNEYGDRNYAQDVRTITGKSVDEFNALPDAQKAPLAAKLQAANVNPYPNYEPLNFAGLPAQPNLPADPGAAPQTLQGLFQIP